MDFITRYMKKTNRNLFLLTLGIFIIAIWLGYTNRQLIGSVLIGPSQLSAAQLTNMKETKDFPSGRISVIQAVDEYFPPVMSEVNKASIAGTRIGEGKTAYEFAYARVGEKYLIVRTEPGAYADNMPLVGQLDPLHPGIAANFAMYSEVPGIKAKLLPFELNTSHDFNYHAFIMLFIICSVVIIALYNTYRLVSRIINPTRHIIYRRIVQQGDPEQIIQQLNDELSEGDYKEVDQYLITKSWIIKRGKLSLKIAKNYFVPGSSYILDDVF
ncbi:hypothetical protein YSY43_08710 [Paenibacillus sp. YSY-4.3]